MLFVFIAGATDSSNIRIMDTYIYISIVDISFAVFVVSCLVNAGKTSGTKDIAYTLQSYGFPISLQLSSRRQS
jgi:hypothetical protein